MINLNIDSSKIHKLRDIATNIADEIQVFIDQHSSVSVERAVLRLFGVSGVDEDGTPIPNVVVSFAKENDLLQDGISKFFFASMIHTGRDVQTTAEIISQGKLNPLDLKKISANEVLKIEQKLTKDAINILDQTCKKKKEKIHKYSNPPSPWKYLIVATGNIYEDRIQAASAASEGADIIAVIRSTAQSLLDYVPDGATTEGFGGTYATQENFKIMREALDQASEKNNRYIRLVNYSSGLCMAEIAACAAIEDLDMLLNDSMYGILFRDINIKRTFVDQYFSRLICSRAKIIINTGEDNYLTTSDAIDNAYTVTASQLINEAMGKKALLTDDLLGLGHAFEINPKIKDALLYEISHALLAKELFPKSPLKYMPPTKYKSCDIFYSHAMDTMFNFTSVLTGQGIHLAGILTEAIHTPLMQDRAKALKSINYVFNIAGSLGSEFELKSDGLIKQRALKVLSQVEDFLKDVKKIGLTQSIAEGHFADIKRGPENGKGLEGVFKKSKNYSNPIMDKIIDDGVQSE